MRPLAVFVVVVSALVFLLGDFAEAAPVAPCVSGIAEVLTLRPAGGVLLNGLILQRDASDGLYRSDAGHVFSVEGGRAAAPRPPPSNCSVVSNTLTVTLIEPFEAADSGTRTFSVAVTP